jgi:hypothetical protein
MKAHTFGPGMAAASGNSACLTVFQFLCFNILPLKIAP